MSFYNIDKYAHCLALLKINNEDILLQKDNSINLSLKKLADKETDFYIAKVNSEYEESKKHDQKAMILFGKSIYSKFCISKKLITCDALILSHYQFKIIDFNFTEDNLPKPYANLDLWALTYGVRDLYGEIYHPESYKMIIYQPLLDNIDFHVLGSDQF